MPVANDVCGAKKKDGTLCLNPAGQGTTHLGTGCCYLHGGAIEKKVKVLKVVNRHPELRERAMVLLEDEDLLCARAELAVLKARFEMLVPKEDDSDVTNLRLLAATISKMSDRIQNMELGRHHYIHVTVAADLVAAFAVVGREYIPDPTQREAFVDEIERRIARTLSRSSARAVAARALTPGSSVVLGVEEEQVEATGYRSSKQRWLDNSTP